MYLFPGKEQNDVEGGIKFKYSIVSWKKLVQN